MPLGEFNCTKNSTWYAHNLKGITVSDTITKPSQSKIMVCIQAELHQLPGFPLRLKYLEHAQTNIRNTHTHKLTKCRVRVFPGFLKLQCQRVCQRQAFITQRSAAENDRAGFLDITECSKKTHSWLCNQRFINKMHKYRISVYAVAFTSLNLFCGLDVDFWATG